MKKTGKMMKGFACMHPDRVKEICTLGGNALYAKRGSKHMARLGRKGGRK